MNLQLTTYNLQKMRKFCRGLFLCTPLKAISYITWYNILSSLGCHTKNTSSAILARRNKLTATRGFTLVETLVAVFILTVAIVSPMSIASQALSSARYAKEQVTAFYLAQEGIELARNIRDNNVLSVVTWNEGTLGSSASGSETFCYLVSGCEIEAKDLAVSSCIGSCDPLSIDTTTGIYTYSSVNTTPTAFTRTIKLQKLSGTSQPEIRVLSTVSWSNGSTGGDRIFTITDNFLNWQ